MKIIHMVIHKYYDFELNKYINTNYCFIVSSFKSDFIGKFEYQIVTVKFKAIIKKYISMISNDWKALQLLISEYIFII